MVTGVKSIKESIASNGLLPRHALKHKRLNDMSAFGSVETIQLTFVKINRCIQHLAYGVPGEPRETVSSIPKWEDGHGVVVVLVNLAVRVVVGPDANVPQIAPESVLDPTPP